MSEQYNVFQPVPSYIDDLIKNPQAVDVEENRYLIEKVFSVYKIALPSIHIEKSVKEWLLSNRTGLAATDAEIEESTRSDSLGMTVLLKDGKTREVIIKREIRNLDQQSVYGKIC